MKIRNFVFKIRSVNGFPAKTRIPQEIEHCSTNLVRTYIRRRNEINFMYSCDFSRDGNSEKESNNYNTKCSFFCYFVWGIKVNDTKETEPNPKESKIKFTEQRQKRI